MTAGKLLTRKRLFLIPVYDDVVRYAFDRPKEIWTALRDALRQDDGSFTAGLEELIKRAGIPARITPLRVLDIALWMRYRSHHTGHSCVGPALTRFPLMPRRGQPCGLDSSRSTLRTVLACRSRVRRIW